MRNSENLELVFAQVWMCDARSYGRYLDDVVGKQLDRIVEGFKKVQLSIRSCLLGVLESSVLTASS